MTTQNISLIGMMGSGKSTIGEALALHLNWSFIDLDRELEKNENTSIAQLVKEKGMLHFREKEKTFLKDFQLSEPTHFVISTGGGLVLQDENRLVLQSLGKVVWLKASAEVIHKRIKGDNSRPLIEANNEKDKIAKIEDILKSRQEIYSQLADFTVEVDDLNVELIVESITKKLHCERLCNP